MDVNHGPFVELLQAWTTTPDNDGLLKEEMNNNLALMIAIIAEGREYSDYIKEVDRRNARVDIDLKITYHKLPEEFFNFISNSGQIKGNIVTVP